jgi:hypothetical protein
VVVVVERGGDQDRAEDLLGEQRAVRTAVRAEQGGRDEVPGPFDGGAAGHELERGIGEALLDEAADPVVVGLGHQGAYVGGLEQRIADGQRRHPGGQVGDEPRVDAAVHEQARGGPARLALPAEVHAAQRAVDGGGRSASGNTSSGFFPPSSSVTVLIGLERHGVAGQQRRGDAGGGEHERMVERDEPAHDAERIAQREVQGVGRGRGQRLAAELQSQPGEVPQLPGGHQVVVAHHGDGTAVV